LIVPAYLVQLGKLPVVPRSEAGPHDVMHAPAACCKVAVYRDMVEVDWSQVVRSPVKYVLAHLMPLQVCRQSSPQSPCTCGKWHPAADDVIEDPVLDVWRRQWVSLNFRPSAPEQAEIFLFNMMSRSVAPQCFVMQWPQRHLHRAKDLGLTRPLAQFPGAVDGKNPARRASADPTMYPPGHRPCQTGRPSGRPHQNGGRPRDGQEIETRIHLPGSRSQTHIRSGSTAFWHG
jgi:hypothetical protein